MLNAYANERATGAEAVAVHSMGTLDLYGRAYLENATGLGYGAVAGVRWRW